MEIRRDYYLEKLIKRKNNGLIKVITGIRRCGKSYLLNNIFYNHLLESGVPADHIIRFAFDSADDLYLIGESLIKIEKEKPAKRELKLFSVEVALTPDVEDNMQLETHIEGSRPDMMAFLETMDVDPKELGSILKHAAKAMVKDFVQQVVNLSESLEGAEMEETED